MGANSSIEWCDHTFNIVWGCIEVSPGCQACYARTLAERYGYKVWGPAKTTPRRKMSESYWRQPLKWNAAAERSGQRMRVFCASMADVFEDHPTTAEQRLRLWSLIEQTPWLDWLLLTKRPENLRAFLPTDFRANPWPNVWLGTSVENQEYADKRIPYLLDVPARVRFLSCEPLLGPVDLLRIRTGRGYDCPPSGSESYDPLGNIHEADEIIGISCEPGIHWIIAGGESGAGARPMRPDWARSLRDQATAAGVSFFMKQMGGTRDKGGSFDVIPIDLQVREMPNANN